MSSPLNTNNKQNWFNNQDTFDCSVSFDQKLTPNFKRRRVPGKLTSKEPPKCSVQILDELIQLRQTQNLSNKQLFDQFEDIVQSLLQKNDALISQNSLLQKQNTSLKQNVLKLKQQVLFLQKPPNNTDNFSIMSYFNNIVEFPVVKPIDGAEYGLIEKTLQTCKTDNNSNIRAFYLSMLQYKETRQLLHALVSEFQVDDDSKLVPLLCTNEGWVQLVSNFFTVIQNDGYQSIQNVYDFLNYSELYDIIFISALRFRVNYQGHDYDTEIQTMRLYTSFGNIFQQTQFVRKPHVNYDTYNFKIKQTQFTIYFIEDLNQYAVAIVQPEHHFDTSVQSISAQTSNNNQSVVEYSIGDEDGINSIQSRVVMQQDNQEYYEE